MFMKTVLMEIYWPVFFIEKKTLRKCNTNKYLSIAKRRGLDKTLSNIKYQKTSNEEANQRICL